jgi:hypothetical protein
MPGFGAVRRQIEPLLALGGGGVERKERALQAGERIG